MPIRFLLLLSLALPLSARAQSERDTSVALPDVTVTATRTETTTDRAPVRVTVLSAEAVEATASRSVADLLEARSTAFVKRYGLGVATLSIRGATAEQTLVLLDGHRIADPQLGQLDLSLLPALLVESVELVHGAGSSLYGRDAVGGVVNLRTRRAVEGLNARAVAGYGAFGEQEGSAMLSGRAGRWSARALYDQAQSEGDFPYLNTAAFPSHMDRRADADLLRRSVLASVGYEGVRHALNASAWYADAERGLPGPAGTPPQGERQWDESLRLWADDRIDLAWGTLRVGGLLQQSALRYRNPFLGLDDTGRTLTGSLNAEAATALGRRWAVTAGLAGGYGRAAHPSLAGGAEEYHGGAFVSGSGSYGRLLLYPALRSDSYFTPGGRTRTAISPGLGLNVQPFAARPLFLKASAGRGFRAPTFNERFWRPGGNPDLRPERGWTFDGGAHFRHGGSQVEITGFAAFTQDQIVWQPGTVGVWTPANVARVERRGFEFGYRWEGGAARAFPVRAGFSYGFAQALDRSDPGSITYGKQLRYAPREQLTAFLGATAGPLRLDLNGRYAGRRYLTADESRHLDPFAVLDTQLRYAIRVFGLRAQLALAVENVTNVRYAVVENHPMPPRHASIRLLIEAGVGGH